MRFFVILAPTSLPGGEGNTKDFVGGTRRAILQHHYWRGPDYRLIKMGLIRHLD
jgi:hypothetical protein